MKGFDLNKLMQQAQQMQAQMAQAQEEIAKEEVEASAGGGMVVVRANGAQEILEIRIDPKAIDPDDPEMLADLVLAAVNEALRSARNLAESKLSGADAGRPRRPGPARILGPSRELDQPPRFVRAGGRSPRGSCPRPPASTARAGGSSGRR